MRKHPPARWVLPETVDPAVRRCIQIDVPDDPAHIAAFRGAMLSLASAYNWSDDSTHKAKDVALVWREIIDSHLEWGCGLAIEFMQDECGLNYREVGSETWIPIYDGLECLDSDGAHQLIDGYIGDYIDQLIEDGVIQGGVGQQSPQSAPPIGECVTYQVHLSGREQWHCPNPVSAGDTIAIDNARGGWCDGGVSGIWACPTGEFYFLGACGDDWSPQAGDPLQTVNHMRLVGKINSVFFDPLTDIYTVPTGTPTGDFLVQANDSNIEDNQGFVDFTVTVCSGGQAWCHVLDFADNDGGFTVYDVGYGGEYVPGLGWRTTQQQNGYRNLVIKRDFTQNVLGTYIKTEGTEDCPTCYPVFYAALSPAGTFYNTQNSLPSPFVIEGTAELTGNRLVISFQHPLIGTPTLVLSKATMRGRGYNPFGTSNCS